MGNPIPRPGIMQISPYIGGEAEIPGTNKVIKLSSNEGALGPSQNAINAFLDIASSLHRYPDGSTKTLRMTIANTHSLNPEQIVCGAGSDEIISLLCKAFAGPGDEVLYSQYGFLMYPISAMAAGATPKNVVEKNLTASVDALLEGITKKTKLVFLANPNNPTGTYISEKELIRLHKGLRDDIILVIDSAYAEYVTRDDYSEGNQLVETSRNVIVTRTFSKSHGLGGLRLGWAYGSSFIIDILNRIRGPFNISAASQAAGVAAMLDEEFSQHVCKHNLKWLSWTKTNLQNLGLKIPDSVGNFLLVSFEDLHKLNAENAERSLKDSGILVRSMKSYQLPNCLRISIGQEQEMRNVVKSLSQFIGAR